MIIREATWQDIPSICRIISQLTPGSPHDYREAVEKFHNTIQSNKDYFLWVVETDLPRTGLFAYMSANESVMKIVATAMMHLQHKLSYNCGTAAHLEDVVVDKDWRGKGIGELLTNNAIEPAKQHGVYKVMLTCFEKTVPYYLRFGFERHDIGMRLSLKEEYPK